MWEKKLLEEVKVWMWKVLVSFHLKTWKGTQWQADQVGLSHLHACERVLQFQRIISYTIIKNWSFAISA